MFGKNKDCLPPYLSLGDGHFEVDEALLELELVHPRLLQLKPQTTGLRENERSFEP